MARRIAVLILLLCVTAEAGALKYVGPTSAGTGAGTSWANRAQADSTWMRTVAAGDTVLFYPGTYVNLPIVPPEYTPGVMTLFCAGDGVSSTPYDPGVSSLGSSFTRAQFEQSLLVAKTCTLTAGIRIDSGATWVSAGGSVYYRSVTLAGITSLNEGLAVSCIQDTTQLDVVYDGVIPTAAGRASYSASLGRLYVWTTDGTHPNTHRWLASQRAVVNTSGGLNTGNCRFYGFDLRCFVYGSIYMGGGKGYYRDSIFLDHCRVTKGIGGDVSNEGAVGCIMLDTRASCGGDPLCTYAFNHKYNRIRACYVAQIWESGYRNGRTAIITSYDQSHFVVESCLAVNLKICDWKNQAQGGYSIGNVARFNTYVFDPAAPGSSRADPAIENLTGRNLNDSAYGNIIVGADKAFWVQWQDAMSNAGHFYCNNTVYQCGNALSTGIYGDHDSIPGWFKYNVISGTTSETFNMSTTRNDTCYVIDSNLYYNGSSLFARTGSADLSYATWQTYTSGVWAGSVYHDIHSLTSNPNFVSASSRDFRRTGSPSEMDVTYGGKRWTSFGAEGASGEAVTYKFKTSGNVTVPNGAGGIQWR